MEESNQLYQLLLNECCVGLSFDSALKQYSFMFRYVSPAFFNRLARQVKALGIVMREDDLNHFLQQVSKVAMFCESVQCHWELIDCNVMVSEVLRLYGSHSKRVDVVKMYAGEYLVCYSDYTLARPFLKLNCNQKLNADTDLYTDDGCLLFRLTNVEILYPTVYHTTLDRYYLPNLADSLVTENLWHTYNELIPLFVNRRPLTFDQQQKVYKVCSHSGISLFTLFYLIAAMPQSF